MSKVQGKYFRIVVQYNETYKKDASIETYVGFIVNSKASRDGKKTSYQNGPIVYHLGHGETISIPFWDLHRGYININLNVSNNYLNYYLHVSILSDLEFKTYSDLALPNFEEKGAPHIAHISNISTNLINDLSVVTKEALSTFKENPIRDNASKLKDTLDSSWNHKNDKGEYIWPKDIKWRGNNLKLQMQKFYGVLELYRELVKML